MMELLHQALYFPKHRVQRRMISLSGHFFHIFEIIIFCFVVAICELVHDVKTIFHLCYVIKASGNCSFTGITHISENITLQEGPT